MLSFDELLLILTKLEQESTLGFTIQAEVGPELVSIVSSRFYHSDEDVGKAVKSLLADSVNNHIYYEV